MTAAQPKQQSRTSWLVSHGRENLALGGPTTRLRQIERAGRARGENIRSTSDVSHLLKKDTDVGLVHVFNSWGLQSALNTLALAGRTHAPVVFSPIMLNLADHAFYQKAALNLLQSASSVDQVCRGAGQIEELTQAWSRESALPPRQGISSHFDFIRRQTGLADRIICLSKYEQDLLASVGIDRDKTGIVRNGVDTETMLSGDPDAFSQRYGIRNYVLMVGRIEPRKNQALTAFALRDLDVPIVCIGHIGDPAYYEQVKRWAGPKFIHIDRIEDRSLLASAYKAASLLILASWSEGAPLVALEAAAAGTPLILSSLSSERDYFGAFAKYVHPADLNGIATAAEQVLKSPETATERSARSMFAAENFSIEQHVEQTLLQYEVARDSAKQNELKPTRAHYHLDATHLAHQIHNKKPLTGVPVVEHELGAALLKIRKSTTTSVWSSRDRIFSTIESAEFGMPEMAKYASCAAQSSEHQDLLCEDVEIFVEGSIRGRAMHKVASAAGLMRKGITLFKYAVSACPPRMRDFTVRSIRTLRPTFSLEVPEEQRLHIRSRRPSSNRPGVSISAFMTQQNTPKQKKLRTCANLIVLGHAWISNDRYLDDLGELISRHKLDLIVHVPDILYVTRPGTFPENTAITFERRLNRILQLATTVITISEQSKKELEAHLEALGLERTVKKIVLGVPTVHSGARQDHSQIPTTKPFALYVASMSERKRHDFLIECWKTARGHSATVQDAKLVLVGRPLPGYERFADPKFHKELEQHGVIVLNDCDDRQLQALYKSTSFSIFPSDAEGWGIPPVESLNAGKPCLVSDNLPVARELTNAGLKNIPATSKQAWVAAIQLWFESPSHLQDATDAAKGFRAPTWLAAAKSILSRDV